MIDVDVLYKSIKDLLRKDFNGWISSDEFNRMLALAQNDIFEYYLFAIQKNHRITNALRTFIEESNLTVVSGYADLPENFRYKLEVLFEIIENGEDCVPVTTMKPGTQLNSDKPGMRYESVILSPDISKKQLAYEFIGDTIKVHPNNFIGRIYLKYYRKPARAERAYTVNSTTFEEVYDQGFSTQLEWNEEEMSNFVDVMLFYNGLKTRESPIIEWLGVKNSRSFTNHINQTALP